MAGLKSIKKPVILEIPIKTIVTSTGTDIPFLTKMQKKGKFCRIEVPFSSLYYDFKFLTELFMG
ncbi:MAG: hypothetical protein DRH90_21800 [Deltaproteobacteria bacterium]|nr:MAG: hypothetical protein DRH90_21800 [Deltaproteobacteria bacterium]RLC11284.1 MAG: hypothetical protein DRI24_19045 [Deltaproteobacteria bacterium]